MTSYVRYWFTTPSPSAAPRNDWLWLQSLRNYKVGAIRSISLAVFSNHLWYLSEILVGLAFFDDGLAVEEKREMLHRMQTNRGSHSPAKRILATPDKSKLADFVTTSTQLFFSIMRLPCDFLEIDPVSWAARADYQAAKTIGDSLKVVNDIAERAVALARDFNGSLSRDSEQQQFLLQVVEHHRKEFPVPTKRSALTIAKQ